MYCTVCMPSMAPAIVLLLCIVQSDVLIGLPAPAENGLGGGEVSQSEVGAVAVYGGGGGLGDQKDHRRLQVQDAKGRTGHQHSADQRMPSTTHLKDMAALLQCATFQVHRLESQVVRYKTAAETAERSEEELKTERRKIQREVSSPTSFLELLECFVLLYCTTVLYCTYASTQYTN